VIDAAALALAAFPRGRYGLAPWLLLPLVGFLGLDVLIAAIWDAMKWVAEKAAIVAVAVAQAVARAAKWSWAALKWFGLKVRDGAYWLKDKAVDFARWFKTKAAPWIANAFRKVDEWFRAHFGWLFKFVKILQNTLGWIYKHVLRPVLTFLEVTRGILRGLAALGVGWAARLEDWLRRLEQRLLNTFFAITRVVNYIGDLLDALFDPTGAFKRKYFVWSYIHWLRDLHIIDLLSMIDHDPWPEAFRLAEGSWILQYHHRAELLQRDLENPPEWITTAGRRYTELLVV
jgi:hypothetical protein